MVRHGRHFFSRARQARPNMTQIELFSPLPPAECAARLREAVDRWDFGPFFLWATGSHPVVGRVSEESFCLWKRISYNNSFQPRLRGTISADGIGTLISGKLAMNLLVRIGVSLWLGFIAVVGSVLILGALLAQNGWRDAIILSAVFAFGWCIVRFSRWLARDDADFLTRFLIETLHAKMTSIPDPYESIAG